MSIETWYKLRIVLDNGSEFELWESLQYLSIKENELWNVKDDEVELIGVIATPLIVKRTIRIEPELVVGTELTEDPKFVYTLDGSDYGLKEPSDGEDSSSDSSR